MSEQAMNQIQAYRQAAEAATEEPWEVGKDGYSILGNDNNPYVAQVHPFDHRKESNVKFIALVRTAVPRLCDALEVAMKELSCWEDVNDRTFDFERYYSTFEARIDKILEGAG